MEDIHAGDRNRGRSAWFRFKLIEPRLVATARFSDERNRSARMSISAQATLERRLLDQSVILDCRDLKADELPLHVNITIDDRDQFDRLTEPLGYLSFHEQINSSDGVVNEPDQMILEVTLPLEQFSSLLSRDTESMIAVKVAGLTERSAWTLHWEAGDHSSLPIVDLIASTTLHPPPAEPPPKIPDYQESIARIESSLRQISDLGFWLCIGIGALVLSSLRAWW